MPVPKRKLSRSRRDKRSASKFIRPKAFSNCKNCEAPNASHQVCDTCGFYKGKKVLETKMDRALKRNQIKNAQQKKMQANDNSTGAPSQE